MLKSWFAAGALSALLLILVHAPSAWAKPADLPSRNQIECPDCGDEPMNGTIIIGLDLLSGRLSAQAEVAGAKPEPTLSLDALLPAYVEQMLQHLGDVLTHPNRFMTVDYLLSKTPLVTRWHAGVAPDAPRQESVTSRENQARGLFEIAEVCRHMGCYTTARTCYQRVHLLAPTSPLGRLAIDRLTEIENRLRDAAEESGADDPETLFHDMRNRSVPLGLVEVAF